MTTANKITILRVLFIPVFVSQVLYYGRNGHEGHRLAAILAYAIAAICDGVDGYIARHYNQRTELGALLDPIADKLLLVSGLIVLSLDRRPWLPQFPLWLVVTVFSSDALQLAGLMILYHVIGRFTLQPRFLGKLTTVAQMICISVALLKWDERLLWYLALATTIGTALAGLMYLREGMRLLSAHPASNAPGQMPKM
jgi:CDP-diacylglycerol--glycerol-3-phosphate 3-phosphatidyltransferase